GAFAKLIRWSFEKQGLYQPDGHPLLVTTVGQPPPVDVFIDDGRTGNYMPFLPDFRGTPEVWNRHAADGGKTHEAPVVGATNFAYVEVRNRGTTAAANVAVKAFHSKVPNPAVWPTE